MSKQIQVTYQGEIALLQIASDEHPYLEKGYVEELRLAVNELNEHPFIKVVIVTGGNINFCLGGSHSSLTETGDFDEHPLSGKNSIHPLYVAEIPKLILSIRVPTIACVEGHALGGGLLIGLWCDLCYLAETSLYGANFMALGFTPGMGGTIIVNEAFGSYLGKKLLFTGQILKGKEIKGLCCPISNFVFPKNQLKELCLDIAEELCELPLDSLLLLKENQTRVLKERLEKGAKEEGKMHQILFSQENVIKFIKEHHQQQ